jgi:DNA repair protein SbcD/Mre11
MPMRLLHTSDWHLGRTVGRRPRDEDFDAVLAEITAIAQEARPDLIVHSGDLFDAYRPSAPDLRRCLGALRDLSRVAPVVVLAGNHDSPAMMEALDFAVNAFATGPGPGSPPRLRFVPCARHPRDGGILDYPARGGEQRIRLAPLPFVHQNRFLDSFTSPGTATRDYARHLREVQAGLTAGLRDGYRDGQDVLIFAAHLYVGGAIPSHTERRVDIDDTYATEASALPPVSYAALGHIHRPQAITGSAITARYAGSPLQLDFGEAGEDKSVVVVDADPGRPVRVDIVPLTAGRRLVDFHGTLDELRARAGQISDAFVRAVISGDQPVLQLAAAARDAAPGATFVSVDPYREAAQAAILDRTAADGDEQDLPELFRSYLAKAELPGAVSGHVLATFSDLLDDTGSEEPGHLGEENLLDAALSEAPAPVSGRMLQPAAAGGTTAGEQS